jgi:hypothetical protein
LKQQFVSHIQRYGVSLISKDTESYWLAGQPMRFAAAANGSATYSQPRVEGGETRVTRPNEPRAKMATFHGHLSTGKCGRVFIWFSLSSSPRVSGLGQYPSLSYRSARIKPFVRERPSDHSETIQVQPQIDRACLEDPGSTSGLSTGLGIQPKDRRPARAGAACTACSGWSASQGPKCLTTL